MKNIGRAVVFDGRKREIIQKTANTLACLIFVFLSGCMASIDGKMSPVDASVKPKIAEISNNYFADAIGTELFIRGFTIRERLRLLAVLDEKSLQLTGVTDEKLMAAGKLLNVDALLMVEADADRTDIHTAFIKIVNVQRGAIIGSYNYQNSHGPGQDSLKGAAKRIAEAINMAYK